ncbi:hypothetical protein GGI07_000911 [Coemansia sp. Benny D115]|nr:hypothetical protein GGI07_000911 [Coemansia sp. Benny D115]
MQVLVDIPNGKTQMFAVCSSNPLQDLVSQLTHIYPDSTTAYLTGRYGLTATEILKQTNSTDVPSWLVLRPRVLGGKGGFGSTLRAQGSKSSKPANYDSCRDLYGRRLKTIKEAQQIVEQEVEKEKALEEAKEKRRLKIAQGLEEKSVKKHRFDDVEYMKNCEEMVENARKAAERGFKQNKDKNADKKPSGELLLPLYGEELDSDLSSSSEEEEEEEEKDAE